VTRRVTTTLSILLLLGGCGGASPSESESVTRRVQYQGDIVRMDATAHVIVLRTSDGDHNVGIVDRTQVVDTSGRRRDITSVTAGAHVQVTTRTEDGGPSTPAAELITILPSGAAPESVIEPPAND
jgi:hypothetical protein